MRNTILPLALLALSQGVLAQQIPGAGTQLQQLPPARVQQSATPKIRIEDAGGNSTGASDSVRVVVNELRLTGVTVFATGDLIALAQFKPGAEVTLSDLEAMASRITEHYRSHGYVVALAFLPVQDITSRVVTIAVREGQYGQVTLRNASRLKDEVPNRLLKGLDGGDVITLAPLESRLLLLSDLPGVAVTSTLAPGAAPGTSDLIIDVSPGRPVTGSIDADNAGNPYTGEYRLGAVVNLNNPLGLGDLASVRLLTSGKGLQYGRLTYQVPLGRATLGASYSHLNYELGEQFEVLGAHGSAQVASVFGTLNLIRSRDSNLYAGLAFDRRRFKDEIDLFSSVTDKQANVAIASLYGDRHDDLGGGGVNSFFVALSAGSLDIQTPEALVVDQATARANGSYSKLAFNLARDQRVTELLSLRASVSGQLASKNLDQSEKMVLGGMDGVRAYPQGEAFGDQGYIASLEASFLLAALSQRVPGNVRLLGFVDGGRVTLDKNPWFIGDNSRNLGSFGLGLGWDDPGNFLVRTYYARKLGSEEALSAPDKSGRFWIQAIKYF